MHCPALSGWKFLKVLIFRQILPLVIHSRSAVVERGGESLEIYDTDNVPSALRPSGRIAMLTRTVWGKIRVSQRVTISLNKTIKLVHLVLHGNSKNSIKKPQAERHLGTALAVDATLSEWFTQGVSAVGSCVS